MHRSEQEIAVAAMANQYLSFSLQIVLSLLCFPPLVHLSAAQRSPTANQTDKDALLAFKSRIIDDPQGATSSWTDSIHHCDWEGVACGGVSGRVVALNLKSRSLIGSLPPHIANLTFLRVIDLQNNTLRGRIPPEIGRLYHLKALALKNNSFSGEIPANLSSCFDLQILDVGRNKLTGKIPPALARLSRLRVLSMHWNDLTGGIPDFIGNLSALEVISLARCPLGGTIPDSLGKLKHLTFLGLGGDNLSGEVPSSIFNLSSISVFSVSENNLTGYLPRDAPINFRWLQINDNFFTGTVPISFNNATKLEFIDFSYNNLSGPLLVNFAGMKNLTKLFVKNNNLHGSLDFIKSLVNCSNLLKLDIGINRFHGLLPLAVSNLSTQLRLFDISDNNISGSIPPGISNLFGLTVLVFRENRLTGRVPGDIGKLCNLQILDFSSNQLSGEIPNSMGNLSIMNELSLQRNELQGTIPAHLGKCQSLILLNLSDNRLHGAIPKEVLTISSLSMALSLSYNFLVGAIPQEVGNLESLFELGVSHNRFSGEIPAALGNCRSLEIISMEENLFFGSIPASLSSLRALQQIDISNNDLSGKIPEFFGTTLCLKKLNLSSNNFNGEVPTSGIFKDAQALSLAGNPGLCGGISELHLPRCGMQEKHLEIEILVTCIVLGVIVLPLSLLYFFKRRKDYHHRRWKLSPNIMLPHVSYATLHKATDGFSPANLVGAGAFGSVYRGMLEGSSNPVAIKVFDLQHKRASKSFLAECEALKEIRHRNLVKLITACSSVDFRGNEFKALIYEFMPQGSLERWLEDHDSRSDDRKLGFVQRLNIAIDVASALNYLHRQCKTPVVHRDLKPSNILLDDEMTAHIADFGLAKFFIQSPNSPNPNQRSTIGINGTVGYAAPEYGLGNEVSPHGDVYSFGILLLQMITGRKPTDPMFDGGVNLHGFAEAALPDRVEEIVDPYLVQSGAEEDDGKETRNAGKTEELLSVLSIGVACSMEIPQYRMDVNDVVRELRSVRRSSMTRHVSISKDIVHTYIQE